jgi:1-deoxy-D-xylulose-5-phosphate synthase
LVGADGPTHAGSFDIAFMRCLPNTVVMCPADEAECRALLTTAFQHDGPSAVRYPRGAGVGTPNDGALTALPMGKGEVRRAGEKVAILAFGTLLYACLAVGENLGATVANMRFVKPLDDALVRELASTHTLIVTVEDHSIHGGAGSAVSEALAAMNIQARVLHVGLPDVFIDQGDPAVLMREAGLDVAGIERQIRAALG